jgi:hypothetical protein
MIGGGRYRDGKIVIGIIGLEEGMFDTFSESLVFDK